MDCSLPGSSVLETLQAGIWERVAISFSRGSSWPRDRIQVSHAKGRLFTDWATRVQNKTRNHALKYLYSCVLNICTLVCVMELPQVAQWSRIYPPMQAMRIQSLGQEDLLEEGTATHSSILAWRILWTEKPVRLQSTGSQRVGHDWSNSSHKHMYYTSIKKKRPSQQKWPKTKDAPLVLG